MSVRPSIHTYIRPSTKSFFGFNEIWHECRGRWVMNDGMQYDPIQGQGHEPLQVGNPYVFKNYLFHHLQCELATDHWLLSKGTIFKFGRAGFFIFVLIYVSRDFELGTVCPSMCMSVRPQSFFNFNEIWLVGRGQWVMLEGMQYDPIQGQGHEPLQVGNPSIFKSYLLHHLQWELATEHWFLN